MEVVLRLFLERLRGQLRVVSRGDDDDVLSPIWFLSLYTTVQ